MFGQLAEQLRVFLNVHNDVHFLIYVIWYRKYYACKTRVYIYFITNCPCRRPVCSEHYRAYTKRELVLTAIRLQWNDRSKHSQKICSAKYSLTIFVMIQIVLKRNPNVDVVFDEIICFLAFIYHLHHVMWKLRYGGSQTIWDEGAVSTWNWPLEWEPGRRLGHPSRRRRCLPDVLLEATATPRSTFASATSWVHAPNDTTVFTPTTTRSCDENPG